MYCKVSNNKMTLSSITHAKSVSAVLEEDVPDAAVLLEELLDVPLPRVVRKVAYEDSGGLARRHGGTGRS